MKLQLKSMPSVCYRAADNGRPRWQFVLIATNKTRGGVTIQSAQIVQRCSTHRVQRTLAEDELLFLQGSSSLAKGESSVLDIQEPRDTDVSATRVDVVIRVQHKNGSISTATCRKELVEAKTRSMAFPLRGDKGLSQNDVTSCNEDMLQNHATEGAALCAAVLPESDLEQLNQMWQYLKPETREAIFNLVRDDLGFEQ